jgi:hypothetical protein
LMLKSTELSTYKYKIYRKFLNEEKLTFLFEGGVQVIR